MATTGEFPPSARAGQAFIHDPKVADVTEVKAQIKLRFRDVRKQPCVVTRSFQLTQKSGGKLEKKDLDQVIQTLDEKTGEKVSVSRKCADINATVPDMMGVSKAILENVVFVHQEESNWPLGESANLKKKFDEIFSATKYTKALEHINKLKKEQAGVIKEFRLKVETLRVQKDHAVRLRWGRGDILTLRCVLRQLLRDATPRASQTMEKEMHFARSEAHATPLNRERWMTLGWRGRHEENSSKASALSQRMLELDSKIAEAQGVIDSCDSDIVGLRKAGGVEGKGWLMRRRGEPRPVTATGYCTFVAVTR